ncbi:MAG: hypothetical protein ABSE45_13530 [Candidatus Acidiferrales bacterium]
MRGQFRLFLWISICVVGVCLTSCQQQINYPAPGLTSISPTTMVAGQPAFNLTVNGGNFTPASVVLWNNQPRVTLFTGTTVLTAQILASDVQNAGTAFVAVETPQPGGGTTPNPATFVISAPPSPVPHITSLSPSAVATGSAGFTLTVTGTNFVSQSTVAVNGNGRSTAFLNTTSLEASIPASDVGTGGTLQITVLNPQPNGGNSNAFSLSVTNPVPGIASLSPTSAQAGGAATTLSITGTSFVPNSVVTINGAPRTTVFGSPAGVQATLTAADLAAGGIEQVQVVNPAPGGGTSNVLTFAVNPTDTAGLPVLVDVAPSGAQANNGVCGAACSSGPPTLTTAGPAVSTTGQFVVFASNSTNLLSTASQPNLTNGASDIFFRNTCLGSTTTSTNSCTPSTVLVSAAANGGAADGPSSEPSLDSAGTHVAYTSSASNLVNYVAVAGGTRQVYWQMPCTTTTTTSCTTTNAPILVSLSADGTSAGNADSYNPVISPDGQYVAFVSLATNLVSNPLVNGVTPQVYIRTICSGVTPLTQTSSCVPTTYLVSTPDGSTPADGPSSDPAIANTGLFVSFSSAATNLPSPNSNPSRYSEVLETSTCVTAASGCVQTVQLISSNDGTTPANGASTQSAISPDGRFVAFASSGINLVAGVGPTQQIYVRDTCAEVLTIVTGCTPSTILVSSPDTSAMPSTPANALSENPSISECGTTTTTTTVCSVGVLIAFATKATNLASNVQNGVENVFVRSTCQDVTTTTTGTPPACTPRTALASQPAGTAPPTANGDSVAPMITGDGHAVAFISSATNLVTSDTNGFADVFLAASSF